jgi:hypothetical protein
MAIELNEIVTARRNHSCAGREQFLMTSLRDIFGIDVPRNITAQSISDLVLLKSRIDERGIELHEHANGVIELRTRDLPPVVGGPF